MGIAQLLKVASSAIRRWKTAPGKAPVVTGTGLGGREIEAEVYGSAGVVGRPPKGARVVFLPLGERYGVVVAAHNYALGIEVGEGETTVYSTDAGGGTLKARIDLDAGGNVDLNGSAKRLVTHSELNTALQALVAAINTALGGKLDGAGTAGALTLDISAAETQTVRTGG